MGSPLTQDYTQYSTIFGGEIYPSDVMGLVKVIFDGKMPKPVATPVPVSLFRPKMNIARPREYLPPEDVDHLDARFSHEEYGSELYKRAKEILFDTKAISPGASRKVKLEDGSVVDVHHYRPWLSHWLICGIAALSQNDERLMKTGITPGEDLEARLVYKNGADFSGAQYKVMTQVMQELVAGAYPSLSEPKRKEGALHNYLIGNTTVPLLGDWELLEVFGTISKDIQIAAASKNKEQFEKQEGFYWAVRMWDVWRSAYRKQHPVPNRQNRKVAPNKWDYVPVAEGYRQLTEGVLERINNEFDWVAIGNVKTGRQNSHDSSQESSVWNNRMLVYQHGADGLASHVTVKFPHQLLRDYGVLTDILRGLMGEYLKVNGQTIKSNSANHILDPVNTAIGQFYPRHFEIISPFTIYDTDNGGDKSREIANDSAKKCVQQVGLLVGSVKDGTFEQQFGIPAGTLDYMLRVMRSIGSHIPKGLSEYIARANQIWDLENILTENGVSNVNRTIEHRIKLASIGVHASNNKELKRAKQRLEELNKRYARSYAKTYGMDMSAFEPDNLSESQIFSQTLSTYGISDLQKYIPLAFRGTKAIVKRYPVQVTLVLKRGPTIIRVKVRSPN